MDVILTGVKNFLQMINENWTLITVVIGLGILVYKKIVNYLALSDAEKIELALDQIRIAALKMVTDAENAYDNWVKAGAIKRSEVIKRIFDEYPILNKVTDQAELIQLIDNIIDEALQTMRDVIEENVKVKEEVQ